MPAISQESVQALQTLGFSELEATIYTFLLQESPTTGYRVAHALDKPVANTYKALSALQSKGAVIVDESENRLCRAVPPGELFGQMGQALRRRCQQAEEVLAKLKTPPEDERVYKLSTWDQVVERARQMIQQSQQVVLVSAFPRPLAEIKEALEAAAERGVGVLLKVYLPVEVRGAHIVQSNETELFLNSFPGEELNLVSDAEEHLVAILAREGNQVLQAVWSSSLFLSFIQYNGLYNEWLLTTLNRKITAGSPSEELQASLQRAFPLVQTPGYLKLLHNLERQKEP